MKPVLRTVIDKNGNEERVFSPSARMILFSVYKTEGLSDEEACDKAKIDRELPGRWRVKYGSWFTGWLEEAMDQGASDDAKILERVGMVNAIQGNFQFWREMARTKGVIKEEVKNQSLTINTDFTTILQMVGGDLNAARAKLLHATRGLAEPERPRVAEPALEQRASGASGEGNRARHVQGRSLALSHALGSNGGCAEQGESLSAVSEQAAFTSTYEVLDDGEVSSGAQIPPDDSDLAF